MSVCNIFIKLFVLFCNFVKLKNCICCKPKIVMFCLWQNKNYKTYNTSNLCVWHKILCPNTHFLFHWLAWFPMETFKVQYYKVKLWTVWTFIICLKVYTNNKIIEIGSYIFRRFQRLKIRHWLYAFENVSDGKYFT